METDGSVNSAIQLFWKNRYKQICCINPIKRIYRHPVHIRYVITNQSLRIINAMYTEIHAVFHRTFVSEFIAIRNRMIHDFNKVWNKYLRCLSVPPHILPLSKTSSPRWHLIAPVLQSVVAGIRTWQGQDLHLKGRNRK